MRVTGIAASSISLSWSVSSGTVITSYEVVWIEAKGGNSSSSMKLTSTSYTITNLKSSTLYNTTVRATNVAGTTSSLPIIISTSNSNTYM